MDNGFAEGYAIGQGNNNAGNMGAWGGEWIWVIVLFALFGWGGNGFGNNNGCGGSNGVDAAVQRGFDTQSIISKLDGINNGICDGFYAQNTNLLTGFSNVQQSLCQGFNGIQREVSDLGYRLQDCCCQTQRAIDGVNYNMAKNTCDITNAINGSTQQILGFLTQEKISSLQHENSLLTAQLSQNAQTSNIINTLRPVAQPAYITCSPYESVYGSRSGNCGNGCGCGC